MRRASAFVRSWRDPSGDPDDTARVTPRRTVVATRAARAGALAAVLLGVATGCTPPTEPPPRTAAPAPPTVSVSATPTPTPPPVLVPGGTAAQNLPYFRSVVETVWASADNLRGGAYVDALTAAGFDRAAMQLTSDTTTIGEAAESIQFSVAWPDGCLVGQVGPATGAPVATVLPLLAGGRCLIGQTVSLDG